jgi:uncharacterized repeat protein (TIGR01451 family)
MKNFISVTLLISSLLSILVKQTNANAQYGAPYGQYQAPVPTQSISVNKSVSIPTSIKGGSDQLEYVDNLSLSDPLFQPGEQVTFRIVIKNTSDTLLRDVIITDFIPANVDAINNDFDVDQRTVTFSAGDFIPGQEKTYFIKVQVFASDRLTSDQDTFCLTNRVRVATNNVSDEDSAQFCIGRPVTIAPTIAPTIITVPQAMPAAGPEIGIAIPIIGLIMFGVGLTIKKKA